MEDLVTRPNRTKGSKAPTLICQSCGKLYSLYSDFRGGDIAKKVCSKCSQNSNGSIDRMIGTEWKRYMNKICPFYFTEEEVERCLGMFTGIRRF